MQPYVLDGSQRERLHKTILTVAKLSSVAAIWKMACEVKDDIQAHVKNAGLSVRRNVYISGQSLALGYWDPTSPLELTALSPEDQTLASQMGSKSRLRMSAEIDAVQFSRYFSTLSLSEKGTILLCRGTESQRNDCIQYRAKGMHPSRVDQTSRYTNINFNLKFGGTDVFEAVLHRLYFTQHPMIYLGARVLLKLAHSMEFFTCRKSSLRSEVIMKMWTYFVCQTRKNLVQFVPPQVALDEFHKLSLQLELLRLSYQLQSEVSSTLEILVQFYEFYSSKFLFEEHALSLSKPGTTYKPKSVEEITPTDKEYWATPGVIWLYDCFERNFYRLKSPAFTISQLRRLFRDTVSHLMPPPWASYPQGSNPAMPPQYNEDIFSPPLPGMNELPMHDGGQFMGHPANPLEMIPRNISAPHGSSDFSMRSNMYNPLATPYHPNLPSSSTGGHTQKFHKGHAVLPFESHQGLKASARLKNAAISDPIASKLMNPQDLEQHDEASLQKDVTNVLQPLLESMRSKNTEDEPESPNSLLRRPMFGFNIDAGPEDALNLENPSGVDTVFEKLRIAEPTTTPIQGSLLDSMQFLNEFQTFEADSPIPSNERASFTPDREIISIHDVRSPPERLTPQVEAQQSGLRKSVPWTRPGDHATSPSKAFSRSETGLQLTKKDFYQTYVDCSDETMRDLWYMGSQELIRTRAIDLSDNHWAQISVSASFFWALLAASHGCRSGRNAAHTSTRSLVWHVAKRTQHTPCLFYNHAVGGCKQNAKHGTAGFHFCLCCGAEEHGASNCLALQRLQSRIRELAVTLEVDLEVLQKFMGFTRLTPPQIIVLPVKHPQTSIKSPMRTIIGNSDGLEASLSPDPIDELTIPGKVELPTTKKTDDDPNLRLLDDVSSVTGIKDLKMDEGRISRNEFFKEWIVSDIYLSDVWHLCSEGAVRTSAEDMWSNHWSRTALTLPYFWALLASARGSGIRGLVWQKSSDKNSTSPCLYYNSKENLCKKVTAHREAGFHFCLCCLLRDHGACACPELREISRRVKSLSRVLSISEHQLSQFVGMQRTPKLPNAIHLRTPPPPKRASITSTPNHVSASNENGSSSGSQQTINVSTSKTSVRSTAGSRDPTATEISRDLFYRSYVADEEDLNSLWYLTSNGDVRECVQDLLVTHWEKTTIRNIPHLWAILTAAHWVRFTKAPKLGWQKIKHTHRYPCLYYNNSENNCNQQERHRTAGFHYCLCCGEEHGVYHCKVMRRLQKRMDYFAMQFGMSKGELEKIIGINNESVPQFIHINKRTHINGEIDNIPEPEKSKKTPTFSPKNETQVSSSSGVKEKGTIATDLSARKEKKTETSETKSNRTVSQTDKGRNADRNARQDTSAEQIELLCGTKESKTKTKKARPSLDIGDDLTVMLDIRKNKGNKKGIRSSAQGRRALDLTSAETEWLLRSPVTDELVASMELWSSGRHDSKGCSCHIDTEETTVEDAEISSNLDLSLTDSEEQIETTGKSKSKPATASEWKRKGNEAFQSGDYNRSIQCYSSGIQAEPQLASLYYNRAIAYLRLEKHKKAHEDATACVVLAPQWARAHLCLGECLRLLGKWHAASDAHRRALEVDPSSKLVKSRCNQLVSQASLTAIRTCVTFLDSSAFDPEVMAQATCRILYILDQSHPENETQSIRPLPSSYDFIFEKIMDLLQDRSIKHVNLLGDCLCILGYFAPKNANYVVAKVAAHFRCMAENDTRLWPLIYRGCCGDFAELSRQCYPRDLAELYRRLCLDELDVFITTGTKLVSRRQYDAIWWLMLLLYYMIRTRQSRTATSETPRETNTVEDVKWEHFKVLLDGVQYIFNALPQKNQLECIEAVTGILCRALLCGHVQRVLKYGILQQIFSILPRHTPFQLGVAPLTASEGRAANMLFSTLLTLTKYHNTPLIKVAHSEDLLLLNLACWYVPTRRQWHLAVDPLRFMMQTDENLTRSFMQDSHMIAMVTHILYTDTHCSHLRCMTRLVSQCCAANETYLQAFVRSGALLAICMRANICWAMLELLHRAAAPYSLDTFFKVSEENATVEVVTRPIELYPDIRGLFSVFRKASKEDEPVRRSLGLQLRTFGLLPMLCDTFERAASTLPSTSCPFCGSPRSVSKKENKQNLAKNVAFEHHKKGLEMEAKQVRDAVNSAIGPLIYDDTEDEEAAHISDRSFAG